jgi:hypothetical protein
MFALRLRKNTLGNSASQIDWENGGTTVSDPMIPLPPFATGLMKTDGQLYYTTKYGNAQTGSLVLYNNQVTLGCAHGNSPCKSGYSPLSMEGGITLLVGGDGTAGETGGFFEGAIMAGQTTDAADDAIQANIASFYGP